MWNSGSTASTTSSVPDPVDGTGLAQAGDQVAMREHHALGQPGGAAGVRQEGKVIRGDRGRQAGMTLAGQRGERGGRRPRWPCRRRRSRAPAARAAAWRPLPGRTWRPWSPATGRPTAAAGGRSHRRGASGLMVVTTAPAVSGGIVGDRELGAVGAAQREHVALGHAARRQPGRGPADGGSQLCVGQHPAGGPVDDGRLAATPRRAVQDEFGSGVAPARRRRTGSE